MPRPYFRALCERGREGRIYRNKRFGEKREPRNLPRGHHKKRQGGGIQLKEGATACRSKMSKRHNGNVRGYGKGVIAKYGLFFYRERMHLLRQTPDGFGLVAANL